MAKTKKSAKGLLGPATIVRVSGYDRFVVADNFKVDRSGNAPVRIACVAGLYPFPGLVEKNVASTELNIRECHKPSWCSDLIVELGSECEMTFSHLFELLKRQPSGEEGLLITTGHGNIVFIRNAAEIFFAVSAHWDRLGGGDWYIYARKVEKETWPFGVYSRVISRRIYPTLRLA